MQAFKMPKFKVDTGKADDSKRVRVEDPAVQGSGSKIFQASAKYSDIPTVYSKFIVEKISKCANMELIEASYAKATWAKHCSALNSLKSCEKEKNMTMD